MLKVVSCKITRIQCNKLKKTGFSHEDIFRLTGINYSDLENENGYIDQLKQNKLTKLLIENGLQEPQLHESNNGFITDQFYEMAYVFNGATIRDCLIRFIAYRPIIGSCDDVFLIPRQGGLSIRYFSDSDYQNQDLRALANFMIITKILRALGPDFTHGVKISLALAKLTHLSEYSEFFATGINLNSSSNEMYIPDLLLDKKNEMHNVFSELALKHVADEKMNAIQSAFTEPGLKEKICNQLKEMVHTQSLHDALELLCQMNNCSRWTLNRKLGKEGVTFNELLKVVRTNESRHLLRNSNKPIVEISDMLGFNSQSSFNRFVMDNLKSTPTEIRQELLP